MIKAAILFLAGIAAIAVFRQFRNRWPAGGGDRLPTPRKCEFCGKKMIGNSKCSCRRGA